MISEGILSTLISPFNNEISCFSQKHLLMFCTNIIPDGCRQNRAACTPVKYERAIQKVTDVLTMFKHLKITEPRKLLELTRTPGA